MAKIKIWQRNTAYSLLRPYIDWCTRTSFSYLEVSGKENIPTDGAIILAPNHCNTLMDALLVLQADRGPFQNIGLTLLIDDGSASSSEIFAGAIQDNHRGKLVGRRSFGKGLVQEPIYFSDGSGVRITVARFYTPSGRCIQKPYSDDYELEVYKRYNSAEMIYADSMKVENGGIIPDVFVPIDTTKVGKFYIGCNNKATAMRFASAFFDGNKTTLSAIDDYGKLMEYLDRAGLEQKFLAFAKSKDGLVPTADEWKIEQHYMMAQVRALVGRYSKLGDKAYYHLYLDIDDVVKAALDNL